MTLYSPEPANLPGLTAVVSKGTDVEVFDANLDMTVPKHVTVTFFYPFTFKEDGRFTTDIVMKNIIRNITDEEVQAFYSFQQIMQNCITSAEAINRRLLNVLITVYRTLEKNSDDLHQLDFMNLRDRLSTVLKERKRIDSIEQLSSTGSVKKFTRTFFRYITDRNIYTHGELSIDSEQSRFLVNSKVDGKEEHYVVDRDILQSHFECYKYLSDTLTNIHVYFQKGLK